MPKPQTPRTLTGLARILARHGKKAFVAPDPEAARQATQRVVIDAGGIDGFARVRAAGRTVSIGVGATFGQVLRDIDGENGLLKQAISMMANPLVRNRVTVLEGLNPESHYFDLSTACLALDARIQLQSTTRRRRLAMAEYLEEAAGDMKPGEFPAAVAFDKLTPEWKVGFFRINPGASKNTVSAAVRTRLRRNVAVGPRIFVSSSTLIPLFAPAASRTLAGRLLTDNNIKDAAERAAGEVMELSGGRDDAYESSLIQVAVARAIRRVTESR